jgi:maltose O-acetyltransferase
LELPKSRPITIGDNVWLGARVVVLGGASIGADSCIGAGSVVVDDVPPHCVAAGVPRVVREL